VLPALAYRVCVSLSLLLPGYQHDRISALADLAAETNLVTESVMSAASGSCTPQTPARAHLADCTECIGPCGVVVSIPDLWRRDLARVPDLGAKRVLELTVIMRVISIAQVTHGEEGC